MSVISCAVLLAFMPVAGATQLDEQMAAFKKADKQTEAAVSTLLKTGLDENRAAEALAVVKSWLDANPAASQSCQYYAGLSMQYAGDWPGAVAFYRRLLKDKSLEPKLAGTVVTSTYRLLINDMRETDSAYLLMREDGDRLRTYGLAKQFDQWFLDMAKRRNDVPAVCGRVSAIYSTASTNSVPDTSDLEWICARLESFAIPDETWLPAAQKLAALPQVPEKYRARVNWVKEIVPCTKAATELFRARKPLPDAVLDNPLKAAEALVTALPYEGSILAARGWMNFNEGHTPNLFKYVTPRRDAKTAPIIKALASLSPQKAQAVLAAPGCPRGRQVFNLFYGESSYATSETKTLIRSLPAVFNSLAAPSMAMFDGTMTVEEAKALSPLLARNPGGHAALVRAYAVAGTNTVSAMVPIIMKSEIWRFDSAKDAIDLVWNCGSRRDGANNAALCKQYENLGARYDQISRQVAKGASSQDRQAAFNALQGDLLGTAPSIPAALELWNKLFVHLTEADSVAMLKTLMANIDGDREFLLRCALAGARIGGHEIYWQPQWTDNFMHNGPQRSRYYEAAAPLVKDLQRIISAQVQAGNISELLFGMWLHAANPQDESACSFMKTLVASPAYNKVDQDYKKTAADGQHFGRIAMTPAMLASDPEYISRELLALPAEAAPVAVEAALKSVVERVAQAPEPVAVYGLQKVAALPTLSAEARANVMLLFKQLAPIGEYPRGQGYEQLSVRIVQDMQKEKRWGTIVPYAAGLWRSAEVADDMRFPKVADALLAFAESAMEAGAPSAALSVARTGLKSGISALSASDQYNPDASRLRRGRLSQVAGKAGGATGEVDIPVDETSPAYPIYKSNSEFVQGNLDSAWSLYKANEDQLKPQAEQAEGQSLLRKLSLDYCFWLLRRNMDEGRTEQAELLVKELTIWSRQAEGTFSADKDAELKIAYADLAFLKGALPTARAWYRKVADADEYKGTEIHLRAALGSVKVDRVTKNFGAALEELDKLIMMPAASARARVHYARAEVLMDQENYKDAFDEIAAVLRSDPNHADALILRGKIQYRMRKLVEASEIELGVTQEHKVMVPGETLKINLNDPTLSVSGVGADIEVEVQARSGDRELVLLHQLGDSKDKYRADVPTALAPPVAGDKALQVLGEDEIRYGYSARFRAKMKDLPPDPKTVIGIASDAQLSLSAGAFPPKEGERRLDIEELGLSTAQRALGMRAVRPGNPVYVRVIDPDQSKTAGIDELAVMMQSSSGDEIRRLLLKETGPYTGVFEGIVPTAGAQAMAFASESAPGRDPNMTISSKPYPGWLGKVGDKEKARTFGIDLNDNVAVDRMSISFDGAGNTITRFVLQTSMNGRDWTTRARYPEDGAPWDGRPRVSSFPTYNGGIAVSALKGRDLPADWQENMELNSMRASCRYLAATVTNISSGNLPIVDTGHPGYSGLLQYRALFYEQSAAIRRFRLTGYPAENTVFLLDGQPAGKEDEDPLTIERELRPGLHEIQVWRHDGRDKIVNSKPVLMCDVQGKKDLAACPDSMFDSATFPEGVRAQIAMPAIITKPADSVGLDVKFGVNTKVRMVRLVILGFDGVAPAVKAVTVADADGKARLPVKEDFMALRQNNQIEVLPGDLITVRYDDPVSATPRRNKHEQRLQVAFNTAVITVSFLNYETTAEGRKLKLEPIRRFKFGDAIAVVVDDADMDSNPKPDVVDVRVATSGGQATTIKAVETEDHSGKFIGRIFPVEGKPARDSEVQVTPGATLTATYRDMENLDPGIPADRSVTIEHAKYATPQLAVYNVSSEAFPADSKMVREAGKNSARSAGPEIVSPRRSLKYSYVDAAGIQGTSLKGVIGASLRFDVVASHLALAGSSEISAYVQVRPQAPEGVKNAGQAFDVNLPGTLKLTGLPQGAGVEVPDGYTLGAVPAPPSNKPPMDEGRFSFTVPLVLGERPTRSFATKDAELLPSSSIPDGVAVREGDVVHIGFAYKDDKDQVQWKTAAVTVGSHAFLDVMNSTYNEPLTRAFVGEKVFVRVLARGLDLGPDRDLASVALKSSGGAAAVFQLRETEAHTGIFKGVFAISYADKPLQAELPSVELNGFPVRYGEDVVVGYAASGETPAQSVKVSINMGADGSIEPFSKRFTGDDMAVKTSFALAECFFELAKKHRQMDQESLARREMEHAQKLLAEAIATHRDDELRAHAEYLLGNLSQEYADLAKNDEAKMPMYQDALARFSKIPVDYPDTEFAPKAQFKTALVYEKMGETEIAVEEYVKLAYKYPKCEYIPEAMSRLGGYFQSKGQAFKEKADPLREKTDVSSKAEVLRQDELSYPEFLKAALIFAKLQERFPEHELAGLAGLRSAQNYMRVHQYENAINGFKVLVDNEAYDANEVRAQALYWSGLSYERWAGTMSESNYKGRGDAMNKAYQIYRRVTFDFPDARWAKQARGRLADPAFTRIVEEDEKARQSTLKSLQEEKKKRK